MSKKQRVTRKPRPQLSERAQGVDLIELVIAQAQASPRSVAGFCNDYPLVKPQPLAAEVLETLAFPNGKPLPPSLKRWLAFDTSWLTSLGWFASAQATVFTPRSLDQIVTAEFEEIWGEMYEIMARHLGLDTCFLLPEGSDSRRIYAVTGEPDALGEYPVLVVDTDDIPYMAIMYPGFDVYMADLTGIIRWSGDSYTSLFEDKRYHERLQMHADHLFHGKQDIEFMDEEWAASVPDE
jgi:hypothetical protein